jgi:hypothetical protein
MEGRIGAIDATLKSIDDKLGRLLRGNRSSLMEPDL